jgi:hypothetical protein
MTKKGLLILVLLISSMNTIIAQKRIIKKVQFEKNEIILNKKKAFEYRKTGNDFVILDLKGNELITGSISKNEKDEWISIIDFKTVNKTFTNKKIIGRNHLIFALAEENIIKKNFEFDEKKLLKFIEKHNELK